MGRRRIVSIVIHSIAAAILLLLFLNGIACYTISQDIERLLGQVTASRWSCSIRGVWVDPLSMQGRARDIRISTKEALSIDKRESIDSIYLEIDQLSIDDIRDITEGDEINISRAKISDGSIEIWRGAEATEPLYLALLIENLKASQPAGSLEIDSMALDIGLTHLSIREAKTDTINSLFSAKELVVKPTFPTDAIFEEGAEYSSWSSFLLRGILASGVSYRDLLSKGDIAIRAIDIDSGTIISYKSREAHQPTNIKPLVYQSLHRLERALRIDTIRLRTMDARYFEMPRKGDSVGRVSFEKISAIATNINNRAPFGSTFTIKAEALVESEGHIEVEFRLPNARGDDRFALCGQMGAMGLNRFNSTLRPLLDVEVKGGELETLSFRIVGSSRSSWSSATMLYHDLSLEALDDRRGADNQREILSAPLLTALGDLIIKESNPLDGKIRVGQGEYRRDSLKSQFNYLWHSLESSIKDILMPRHQRDHTTGR